MTQTKKHRATKGAGAKDKAIIGSRYNFSVLSNLEGDSNVSEEEILHANAYIQHQLASFAEEDSENVGEVGVGVHPPEVLS